MQAEGPVRAAVATLHQGHDANDLLADHDPVSLRHCWDLQCAIGTSEQLHALVPAGTFASR